MDQNNQSIPSLKDDFLDIFPGLKGPVLSPEIICPHCQTKGQVETKTVKRNAGLDGGKIGAFVIGVILGYIVFGVMGVVIFLVLGAIGSFTLKKKVTEANCGNCKSTWDF